MGNSNRILQRRLGAAISVVRVLGLLHAEREGYLFMKGEREYVRTMEMPAD